MDVWEVSLLDKYRCRHFEDKTIPCNWCISGFCGVDACQCKIEHVS
jgi:hypothetical protein